MMEELYAHVAGQRQSVEGHPEKSQQITSRPVHLSGQVRTGARPASKQVDTFWALASPPSGGRKLNNSTEECWSGLTGKRQHQCVRAVELSKAANEERKNEKKRGCKERNGDHDVEVETVET